MRELVLDAITWMSPDDVYDAFFSAVGAPSWHGRNFDALRDSIVTGRINRIEVPYSITIKNFASISENVKEMATDFIALIREFRDEGCPIDVRIET